MASPGAPRVPRTRPTPGPEALGEPLDTARRVETPEGVELPLRPAGPLARARAQLLDTLISMVAVGILSGLLGFLGALGLGLFFVMAFIVFWLLPVPFEVLWDGRTLGKRTVGLRVVRLDGRPVDLAASLLRNLVKFMDLIPGFYLVGLIALLVTRDFQRLGDLVAGTLVVHEEPRIPPVHLPEGPTQPPPCPLDPEEQSALVAFAARSTRLTPARSEELSDLLAPLTGATGPEGLARSLAMARHLWGGR